MQALLLMWKEDAHLKLCFVVLACHRMTAFDEPVYVVCYELHKVCPLAFDLEMMEDIGHICLSEGFGRARH